MGTLVESSGVDARVSGTHVQFETVRGLCHDLQRALRWRKRRGEERVRERRKNNGDVGLGGKEEREKKREWGRYGG